MSKSTPASRVRTTYGFIKAQSTTHPVQALCRLLDVAPQRLLRLKQPLSNRALGRWAGGCAPGSGIRRPSAEILFPRRGFLLEFPRRFGMRGETAVRGYGRTTGPRLGARGDLIDATDVTNRENDVGAIVTAWPLAVQSSATVPRALTNSRSLPAPS